MPKIRDEATIKVQLTNDDVKNLAALIAKPVGAQTSLTENRIAVKTDTGIIFEDSYEVEFTFDWGDFAP